MATQRGQTKEAGDRAGGSEGYLVKVTQPINSRFRILSQSCLRPYPLLKEIFLTDPKGSRTQSLNRNQSIPHRPCGALELCASSLGSYGMGMWWGRQLRHSRL